MDAAGNESAQSNTLSVTTLTPPDVTPPSVPAGLTASAIGAEGFVVSWQSSTDNVAVTGYNVFLNGIKTANSPVAATTNTFAGLAPNTGYSVTVSALDAAGNESAQSNTLSVTTLTPPDVTPPSVPAGLTASSITLTGFVLNWQPSTDNVGVTGYNVFQNGIKINGTPVTGTSFTLTGLAAGTTYSMTVVAIDAAGNMSVSSNPLAVTTQTVPPKNILFIVGSTTLNTGDNAIRNRLLANGYSVNVILHSSSLHPAPLSGVDLVFISATTLPGNLTSRYKGANVPVIVCEPFILDDMGMTPAPTSNYGTLINQTDLDFISPNHPISNGLSGVQTISTAPRDFVWGTPNTNATVIGTISGNASRAGIFLYEKGRLLPDNSLSANKRGFMWLSDNTFVTANATGQSLFDRMIQWAVGTLSGIDSLAPSAPSNLVASNVASNSFTLSWNASTDNVGVVSYDVFRNNIKINTLPVTATSFQVSGLSASTTYQMTVRALDGYGNLSNPSTALPVTTLITPGSEMYTFRTVIASQSSPWDIVWGPDNQIWYTERTAGRVARVNPATGVKQTLLTLGSNMVQLAGQDGLMGMAIHPEFNSGKPFVYIGYTYQSVSTTVRRTRIQRYTFNSTTQVLESPVTILENIPGSNDHNSGRMTIGPDNKLYYTVGDMGAGQFDNASRTNNAQALHILEGKILRLNLEPISGSWIPQDNPFSNAGSKTAVYSLGHRNPQGLVWGNVNGTNRLYSTEHGPFSDDEVNIISSGGNYGWPQVIGFCDGNYNGRNTGGFTIVNEAANCSTLNSIQPIFSMFAVPTPPTNATSFTTWPSVAPSGMDFYSQSSLAGWQNSLLIATLKNGTIARLKLNADGTGIFGDTIHYFRGLGRFRDVIVSPDGTKLYVACDNSGSTSGPTGGVLSNPPNPGSILEFTFTGAVPPPPSGMITQLSSQKVFDKPEQAILVYPNPAKGHIMVRLENWTEVGQIALIAMDGKPAKQAFVTAKETRIPLDYLKGGIYILRVIGKDGKHLATEKVMVVQ